MKAALALIALSASLAAADNGSSEFQIVVHENNPVSKLSASQLELLFLKKETAWPDGGVVEPVDQSVSSLLRAAFTRDVHGKKVSAVQAYWQKLIFSGRGQPPPVVASDAEVLEFVRSHPRGIGYVSRDARLGPSLKAVEVSP